MGSYTGVKDKILMKHNVCGHEYKVTPSNFFYGRRCPICSKKAGSEKQKSRTTESLKQELYNLVGDEYTLLNEYISSNTPIILKHNKCGYNYCVLARHFINEGRRCPRCNNKRINRNYTYTDEEFKQVIKEITNDEYTPLTPYVNSRTYITMRHNICCKEWQLRPTYFLNKQSTRCPYCNKISSNEEQKLISYIKKFNINFKTNTKSIISPYELDIYIPDKKLAIEFDGLYWHSDLHKENDYHLMKTNLCKEQGIQLIHIFEDEWMYKEKIVKDKIKTILGLNKKRIYARECIIKEVSSKDKRKFLEKNSIQGNDKSSIRLGLYTSTKYYEQEILVAVMTFCKPRKRTKYDYELSRYASLLKYNVIGGFSKLLKYFERNYEWTKIVTYADKRWSAGNLYSKYGFDYIKDTEPNYWYFEKTEKIRYLNITDKDKDYLKIYDCGDMIFEYIRK